MSASSGAVAMSALVSAVVQVSKRRACCHLIFECSKNAFMSTHPRIRAMSNVCEERDGIASVRTYRHRNSTMVRGWVFGSLVERTIIAPPRSSRPNMRGTAVVVGAAGPYRLRRARSCSGQQWCRVYGLRTDRSDECGPDRQAGHGAGSAAGTHVPEGS